MTPKEKAKEFFYKFFELGLDVKSAKQCALIAVDEILDAVTTIADKKYEFYHQVKKEIEAI